MSKLIDLTGQVFGKWTVMERAENNSRGVTQWLCQCDCGRLSIIVGCRLRNGRSTQCRRCAHRQTGQKCSIGSGPIQEARFALGLTQEELARQTGLSCYGIGKAERQGRFFSENSGGPAAQLKFNKGMSGQFRQQRHSYRSSGIKRVENHRARVTNCAYCGGIVLQREGDAKAGKKPACNRSHANLYRHRGPIQKPAPAPFGSTVPVINPRIERARKSRKADLWRGMDKTLREAQEAKQ